MNRDLIVSYASLERLQRSSKYHIKYVVGLRRDTNSRAHRQGPNGTTLPKDSLGRAGMVKSLSRASARYSPSVSSRNSKKQSTETQHSEGDNPACLRRGEEGRAVQ